MSRLSDFKSAPFELFKTDTDTSDATLTGAKFRSADEREFVLVQNAGTALSPGLLVQSPAAIANHQDLVVTSFTAATTQNLAQVVVTLGGTLTTAAQYAGGLLIVEEGTGIGQTLKISTNTAQSSGSGACTVTLEDAPVTALDTSSKVSLRLNSYGSANGTDVRTSGVVVCPTTLTGQIVGAAIYPIAASTSTVPTYGYLQTRGVAGMINHSGTTIGLDLGNSTQSTPVAGATETYVVANNVRIGYAVQTAVDTKATATMLQL